MNMAKVRHTHTHSSVSSSGESKKAVSCHGLTEHLGLRSSSVSSSGQSVWLCVCKQTVCTKEAEDIQRKIQALKQLQQNQEYLTETSEKAQNTNDLVALLRYIFLSHTHTHTHTQETLQTQCVVVLQTGSVFCNSYLVLQAAGVSLQGSFRLRL